MNEGEIVSQRCIFAYYCSFIISLSFIMLLHIHYIMILLNGGSTFTLLA